MAAVGCDRCRVRIDDEGRAHHDPGCPEMFFGGDRSKPRGVVPEGALPPFVPKGLRPHPNATLAERGWVHPSDLPNAGGLSPIGIEMAQIFSTLPPRVVVRDEEGR